jgi:peptidyl-tRNA hydrolase, PTH1 family
MLIFTGLGNPGARYAKNRHNIGYVAVDAIAREHGFAPFRKKFDGEASEGVIADKRVLLLKPTTFMNDSGRSVGAALRFYKGEIGDVTVFHDELDLAPGKLRVKIGGGNAGHNGLRSISTICGNDYRRVRLGIGHPGDKSLVYGTVLSDFSKDEWLWVRPLCDAVAKHAALLAAGEDASFQNKVHLDAVGSGQ